MENISTPPPQNLLPNLEIPFSVFKDLYTLPKTVRESLFHFTPIDPKTIKTAEEHISNLFYLIRQNHISWTEPHITTKGNGDICFEWWKGQKLLEWTIEPDGKTMFIAASGSKILRKIEKRGQLNNTELMNFWRWLIYDQPLDFSGQFLDSFNQFFDIFSQKLKS